MATFSAAAADLVRSVYEGIAATLGLVVHLVRGAAAAVLRFVLACMDLVVDVFQTIVVFCRGLGKFVVGMPPFSVSGLFVDYFPTDIKGNFVVLGAITIGVFLYAQRQQQQKRQSRR